MESCAGQKVVRNAVDDMVAGLPRPGVTRTARTDRQRGKRTGARAARPAVGGRRFCTPQVRPAARVPEDAVTLFHQIPAHSPTTLKVVLHDLALPHEGSGMAQALASNMEQIVAGTPLPKGKTAFSGVHVIFTDAAEEQAFRELSSQGGISLPVTLYTLDSSKAMSGNPALEHEAIFEVAEAMILEKADRATLCLFASSDQLLDGFAGIIGLLPFRGVSTALVSTRSRAQLRATGKAQTELVVAGACSGEACQPPFRFTSPSGVFDIDCSAASRMGMVMVSACFSLESSPSEGDSSTETLEMPVRPWEPVSRDFQQPAPLVHLPFKINAQELPMLTYTGAYADGLKELSERLAGHYQKELGHTGGVFPIVSCGETVDALGYGSDVLAALEEALGEKGFYFAHHSGETFKSSAEYGDADLLASIAHAKRAGQRVLIVAVGGGVNGNSTGLMAALTGADFVEVPTTIMHYNDATTSAKKAFSLVVDGIILSKNILGAFYLPRLVYCINETFLTISSANAHAVVGEATKTMNMLGMGNLPAAQQDYHNIAGAVEFASDFSKILLTSPGFERLVSFITDPSTLEVKREIIAAGVRIAELRRSEGTLEAIQELQLQRQGLMSRFRGIFYSLPAEHRAEVDEFMTTINAEIVKAKAMFLAYSDPFEKYRALLFEYAHTLGHGVEAFMNGLYQRVRQERSDEDDPVGEALRLHGQCVGMAVVWAGQMSSDLGELRGAGLQAHQAIVYLFNRFGGFSFRPLRNLCDELGVGKEEFCEGVLRVVRRDNKRGYCCDSSASSVDQLVAGRPGRMLRSEDPNAELRYLVPVEEAWQRSVLSAAFDGEFDLMADVRDGHLDFVPCRHQREASASAVALHVRQLLGETYGIESTSCA